VRDLAVAPDGRTLAAASFDGTTAVWDVPGREWLAALEGHESEVKSAAFSASGAFLATCSRDKSVWVWELLGAGGGGGGGDVEFECVAVLQEHGQDVKRVRWHPREDVLLSCGFDGEMRLWREAVLGGDEWGCAQVLRGHTATVWDASFNAPGDRLASVSADRSCRIWARGGGGGGGGDWSCIQVLADLHARPIYAVSWRHAPWGRDALSPQAAQEQEQEDEGGDATRRERGRPCLLTAGGDACVRLLGPPGPGSEAELALLGTLPQPHGLMDVNAVAWCPGSGRTFATGGDDAAVRVWQFPPSPSS
jgi:WD40 repeat protein